MRRQRCAEQVTLVCPALLIQQEGALRLGFDALGEHRQAQTARHCDDGRGELDTVRIARDVMNEAAIDLQLGDREALEVGERRIAGTEVVDRQVHAQPSQTFKEGRRPLTLFHQPGFRDLQFQTLRRETAVGENRAQALLDAAAADLLGRDVHRQHPGVESLCKPGLALQAYLALNPVAKCGNQACLLHQRNEGVRSDRLQSRGTQPHQRFGPDHAPVAEIHLRLVEHLELVLLERSPQAGFHRQSRAGGGGQLLGVEAVCIPALSFGLVHRRIGTADQRVGTLSVVRIEADPDAGLRIDFVAAGQAEGNSQGVEQFLGDGGRLLWFVETLEQQHELVAAEATERILAPQPRPQSPRHAGKKLVTSGMAETVVDRLEVVQIDEENRHPRAGSLRDLERMLESRVDEQPVGQSRQRIVVGQPAQAGFGFLEVGDIGKYPDVMAVAARWVTHHADRHPLGVDLAILAPVADLALPMSLLEQTGPHVTVEGLVMAPRTQARGGLAEHFVLAVAGNLGESPIHRDDGRIEVGHQHAVTRALECGRVQPHALFTSQVFQGALELGQGEGQIRPHLIEQGALLRLLEARRGPAQQTQRADHAPIPAQRNSGEIDQAGGDRGFAPRVEPRLAAKVRDPHRTGSAQRQAKP